MTCASNGTIRPATTHDWPAIWPIFDDVVRAGETYAYPLDLSHDESAGWWMEKPPGVTVVLDEAGVIVGTAKMGPNRPGRGDHVGTASFMVASTARGRGVGRRLGEHVIAWHRAHSYRAIQFNAVVETNLILHVRARPRLSTSARNRRGGPLAPASSRSAWPEMQNARFR